MQEREMMRWLQLTYKVPSEPSQKRVWVWRRLQNFGAYALQNSVYLLPFSNEVEKHFRQLAQEIRETWTRMPSNLLGVPVFALLIWLHTPLWIYFVNLIRALRQEFHRRIVIAAIMMVSAAYLIIFAIVFDYSRWISNWAVCMFLILHAVKTLPSSQTVPPISADDRKVSIFGWIVTVIPRVGIVRPF